MGNTSFKFLENFPLDSCDSASWAHMGKYGFVNYWNPQKEGQNKCDSIYLEEFIVDDNVQDGKGILFHEYYYREELETFWSDTFGLTYLDIIGPNGHKP